MPISRRAVLTAAAAPAFVPAQTSRPNILLVLSDDHSAPYLGCYGSRFMSTPAIDAFAAEGLRFDRAFTAAPQCVPSRTAIMTGRSPVAVRMGRFSSPLPPDVITLPEVLRAQGYYTGVCGRYFHLDGVAAPNPVTEAVYRKYNMRTWSKRVDYLETPVKGGPGAPTVNQKDTAAKLDEFASRTPKRKPWFFWINYSDPHHVWDPGAGNVDPGKVVLPPHLPDLAGVRGDLARYCGEVERMDGFFRDAMAVLKRRGLDEDTLVVFMGDNGMAFPHGKGSLYDPGLNVPLIARWPGRIKAGAATRSLVSGEDIAPTLIEAAGGVPPKEITGRSFLPLLTGRTYEPRRHIFAARLHHGNAAYTDDSKASRFDLSRCVRSGRWKLIYNCTPHMEYWPVDSGNDPSWQEMLAAHRDGRLNPEHEQAYFGRRRVFELYDLDADPGELNNLAGRPEHAEVQRVLTEALQEKMIVDYDFLPPPIAS